MVHVVASNHVAAASLGSGFNPAYLADGGLGAWYRADDGVSSGAQWNDSSGNGNHAIQATAINRPTYVASAIGGMPAYRGRADGVNNSLLEAPDSPTLKYAEYTAFAVGSRLTDLNASEHIAGRYETTGNMREQRLYIDGTAERFVSVVSQDGSSGTIAFLNPAVPAATVATPFIVMGAFTKAFAQPTSILQINRGAQTLNTTSNAVYNGSGTLTLFGRAGLADPYAGYLAEYILFRRFLSDFERFQIWAYLSAKYGIVIS